MVKDINGRYRTNTLLIKQNNQNELAIQDYRGLHFLDLNISSPQTKSNLISNFGIDGQVQNGPILYGSRTATANFYLETNDVSEFENVTHEIYNKFFSRGLMRVRQSDDIARCFYGIPKPFEFSHVGVLDSTFSIEFDIPSAYLYSVIRSSQFPINANDAEDLINTNLNLPGTDLKYESSPGDFSIYNPSDFEIEPYEQNHELNITFRNGTGSPQLVNNETVETFRYQGNMQKSDVLVLKGVHPFLNDSACEIDTNHGSIDLLKGKNNFSLTGYTGTVSFDFPFIYQ